MDDAFAGTTNGAALESNDSNGLHAAKKNPPSVISGYLREELIRIIRTGDAQNEGAFTIAIALQVEKFAVAAREILMTESLAQKDLASSGPGKCSSTCPVDEQCAGGVIPGQSAPELAVLRIQHEPNVHTSKHACAVHLEHESRDNRLPDVGAPLPRSVVERDDRVDDLHRGQPARHVRIDNRVGKREPAMLDRSALAVHDNKLRLLVSYNHVHRASKFVTAQLVTPRAGDAGNERLHAKEQLLVRAQEAHALGVGDHGVRLHVTGKVQDRTTAGVIPIASAIALKVTRGSRRRSTSSCLNSFVTKHAA